RSTTGSQSIEVSPQQLVLLDSALKRLRKRLLSKRALHLEAEWRDHDPRRLGVVSEQDMSRVLRLYGVDSMVSVADMDLIRACFVRAVTIPSKFYDSRREANQLSETRVRQMFHYREFCQRLYEPQSSQQ